jgi:hypothetical protein
MRTQCLRDAVCDLLHCCFGALEPVDRERKVQWLLDFPDAFMLSRWQYLRRASNCNPTYGNGCAIGDMGLKVYNSVNPNFAALTQASRMKDRSACGDEHLIFDGASHHMSVGPNEAIISDGQGVTRCAPENCVFHDDALSPYRDGPTLSDDLCTVHDATAWTDRDVAAHNCIWCYPSRRIDLRRKAVMFDEQNILLIRNLKRLTTR